MYQLKSFLEAVIFALVVLTSGVVVASIFLVLIRSCAREAACLVRKGFWPCVLLALMALVGIRIGFAKTNGTNRTNAPRRVLVADDASERAPAADCFRFESIVRTSSNVTFVVHWPTNETNFGYDVFARPRLESGSWNWLSYYATDSFSIPISVLNSYLPNAGTNGLYSATGFFTLGSDHDADGDLLSDAWERYVYGTSPTNPDSDFDGLPDGDEVNVYGSDPRNPYSLDPAFPDGMALSLGRLDPFEYPYGSTNTVWEHLFYTGSTDQPFSYPESTPTTAVLRVSAVPGARGLLVVGGRPVPFYGGPAYVDEMVIGRNIVTPLPALLLSVPRGVRQELQLLDEGGVSGSALLDSDDFAFGELPDGPAGGHGWLVFPETRATEPCIHDLNARQVRVTLDPGPDARDVSCVWEGTSAVGVRALSSLEAELTGRFPRSATVPVSYTLNHPLYLFGRTTYSQTARFCPQSSSDVGEDTDSFPPWLGQNGGPAEDEVLDDRWCCLWGTCCGDAETCSCGCDGTCCSTEDDTDVGDGQLAETCPQHLVPYEQCAAAHLSAYTNATWRAEEYPGVLKIRDPLDYDPIHLSCPDDYRRCCDCPDHSTNYVAVAYKSGRLALIDAFGRDFSRAFAPCVVRVAGVRPSSAAGDAKLAFLTNGVVSSTYDYTVLGVGFAKPNGPALSVYNDLSRTLGVPMTVTTNVQDALQLDILTNVRLPSGDVQLSIDADDGAQFTVWAYDGRRGGYWRLLDTDGHAIINLPISRWRRLVGGSSQPAAPVTPIYITSAAKGSATLRIGYWCMIGDKVVQDWQSQMVTSVAPPLLPDYNRDGRIDGSDVSNWRDGRKLYFWSNEDTWRGDDAFAGYESGVHAFPYNLPKNRTDMVVNGRNDLVNLLPFAINLRDIFEKWGDGVLYEFFTGNPGNIRFVFAQTKWDSVGELVKVDQRTLAEGPLHEAPLIATDGDDQGNEIAHVLPLELLGLGEADAGVVVTEYLNPGRQILSVRVRRRGMDEVLFSSTVNVQVSDVHGMYRWLNFQAVCGEDPDPIYLDRESVSWPDVEHADANVIFVHGYNMSPSEAWDWSQAMFKRLWWSGMDAGFTAVLWRGNQTQFWLPGKNAYATKNYHQNVLNAFRTAGAFKTAVEQLPGGRKYFIAHSLGNMLVSAARQDHGLAYEKYFMLNAAVPVEAYDASSGITATSKHDMTPAKWRDYPDRVRASHWYGLFPWWDARARLTWKNRFKDVDKTVNFYSQQDEVVANGNDEVDELLSRKYAWYNQEMKKGSHFVDLIPEAGWAFGRNHFTTHVSGYTAENVPIYSFQLYSATEAAGIDPEVLKTRPLFRDFTKSDIYGENGSAFLLANDMFRWRCLSHGIPAESFAVGANPVPKWNSKGGSQEGAFDETEVLNGTARNVDMSTKFKEHRANWLHSYFISAPLLDVHGLFERIVDEITEGNSDDDN